jgi:putative copper resistance protein D
VTLLVVWLHLLAVVTWIGCVLYQSLALLPAVRPKRVSVFVEVARRARPISWAAASVVVLTGFYNVTRLGPLAQVIESGAALILAGKFILVIAAIAVAGQRDFAQLPRVRALLEAGVDPAPALRAIAWLDRVVLFLAAVIIYLGLALSRR